MDGQDKAEQEIKSTTSEVGVKSDKETVKESKDVRKKPAPKTICPKVSDLQLKKDEDAGPEILYLVQETENLTAGNMVKSKQGSKSVEESGKEGSMADPKMSEPFQETKNPDVASANKREQAVSSANSLNVNKEKVIEFHKRFCSKRWGVKGRIRKQLKRYILELL